MSAVRLSVVLGMLLADSAAWAATLTVNTTLDTVVGACGASGMSLRKAIGCAAPGDAITFSTTVFPTTTVTAISVSGTQLPNLSDIGLTLDGGGRVRLDGSALAGSISGLHVTADAVQITGLEIVSFPASGIVVNGSANVVVGGGIGNVIRDNAGAGVRILTTGGVPAVGTLVSDNFIGTDASGNFADGNCTGGASGCAGVLVGADAADTVITGNVISGNANGPGVLVRQSDTVVSDNLIGTNAAGSAALPNQGDGILVTGGPGVLVTGVEITGNQVSGNALSGVVLGSACAGAIVQDNLIGTDPAGTAALPNGQDGVRVSGSDGHIIGGLISGEGNVISGNLGSGIAIGGATGGDWASDVFVGDNRIGTDAAGAAALPNGRYGMVTSGQGGGHQVGGTAWTTGGNLVSGNPLGGVWIGDPHVTLTANRIGTDVTGLVAVANGLNPLGLLETVFGGVLVDALDATIGTSTASGNLVSGNQGDGVWLRHDGVVLGFGFAYHELYGNLVGTSATGNEALGNTGDGIRVQVGSVTVGAQGKGNLVAANDGFGVHVVSAERTAVLFVTVEANEIGRIPAVGPALGNTLGGIRLVQDVYHMPVVSNIFFDNIITGNGDYGILFSGPAGGNTASRNRIHDNDLCAIHAEEGAQHNLAAPTIVSATSTLVTVLVEGNLVGGDVQRVEVFSDSDTEAETWLGDATLVTGRTWTLTGSGFPPHARIRALMVMEDGTSSALTDTCGDGCAVPHDMQCDDGNACTTEWCDERRSVLACVSGDPRPVGWRCEDGDRCTGVVTATTFLPDVCDANGTCQAGEEIEVVDAAGGDYTAVVQSECPWSSDCNVASCTPTGGCAYAPLCDSTPSLGLPDSACTPDDLDEDPSNNDCEQCDECFGLDDDDGDGLKDDWELNGVDTNCDGTPDFILNALANVKNVFLEIDYMSANCDDDDELHTHKPSQAAIDDLVARFELEAGITLTVDVNDCIPEVQLIAWSTADAFPGDPDCDSGDFVFFNDLKVQYFDAERRGIYHYAILAHSFVREHFDYNFLQNDGLCLGTGRPSGEVLDDDVIVALAKEEWVAGSAIDTFPEQSVSALLHELGHNFGLWHGGLQSDDEHNYKPNYQSEMNYRYSYGLDDGTGVLESNYSREVLTLASSGVDPVGDEAHLNEAAGLESPTPEYLVDWDCVNSDTGDPVGSVGTAAQPIPLDFDCDGDPYETDVEADINGQGGIQPDLDGWDDWDNLNLHFQCGSNSLDDGPPPNVDAGFPAWEDAQRMGRTFPRLHVGVDIAPSCAASPVLVGGGSSIVKVVVAGGAGWSVDDLVPWSVRLQGAPARRLERVDVDADTIPDAVLWFDSGEMYLSATASQGFLSGKLQSARRLYGYGMLTAVASLPDADGDGVTDVCDACAATMPGLPVDDAGCP